MVKNMFKPLKIILVLFSKPKISKSSSEYTKITFTPDYEKFGVTGINEFTRKILEKRVIDICAITPKTVSVFLNKQKITIKDFSEYVSLYLGDRKTFPRSIQENERWKVCIAPSDNGFQSVSFVNGIHTFDGGSHIEHIMYPIIKSLQNLFKKNIKTSQLNHSISKIIYLFL